MKNYFPEYETQCKCGCGGDITDGFRAVLNLIRADVGEPMPVNSGYRCKYYDLSIGGKGIHPTGEAADIGCSGYLAHKIMKSATKHGIKGIGVKQKGAHSKRFLHLDNTNGATRPWIWSY